MLLNDRYGVVPFGMTAIDQKIDIRIECEPATSQGTNDPNTQSRAMRRFQRCQRARLRIAVIPDRALINNGIDPCSAQNRHTVV